MTTNFRKSRYTIEKRFPVPHSTSVRRCFSLEKFFITLNFLFSFLSKKKNLKENYIIAIYTNKVFKNSLLCAEEYWVQNNDLVQIFTKLKSNKNIVNPIYNFRGLTIVLFAFQFTFIVTRSFRGCTRPFLYKILKQYSQKGTYSRLSAIEKIPIPFSYSIKRIKNLNELQLFIEKLRQFFKKKSQKAETYLFSIYTEDALNNSLLAIEEHTYLNNDLDYVLDRFLTKKYLKKPKFTINGFFFTISCYKNRALSLRYTCNSLKKLYLQW